MGLIPSWTKQPFYFTRKETLAFAAIWEGETVATVTTDPNAEAAQVHDRMPVILKKEQYDQWMAPDPLSEEEIRLFLCSLPDGSLDFYPVDRRVGSVRFDDPSLIEPIAWKGFPHRSTATGGRTMARR